MKYSLTVLVTAILSLIAVAVINWTVDPAGVFGRSNFGEQYADALLRSKSGVAAPLSLDERVFKVEMAKSEIPYDCVVVGSSHVMQIGSDRKHRSLLGCRNILNLGVSGAGLEDQITLAWLSLLKRHPRRIFLGIDPWTLAYSKDERWQIRYPDEYRTARFEIGAAPISSLIFSSRWSNLISSDYTIRSIETLRTRSADEAIELAPLVDDEVGGPFPISLPDGSHVYSAEYIAKSKSLPIPLGGEPYKVSVPLNEKVAVEDYQLLLKWIIKRGVQPVLLMTPYHQNVWNAVESQNVLAMTATEQIVSRIGSELKILVVGSYRPERMACSPDDFFDFMHPTPSCLSRVNYAP